MPDRDVYDRNVERGWQTAARHLNEENQDELTLTSFLRALGRTLKDGGCPGIDTIASITARAVGSADPSNGRREVSAQLEQVRRESGSTRTEIAVDVARSILVDADQLFPDPADRRDQNQVELVVAEAIIVGLAIQKTSHPALMQELVEKEHKTIDHVLARRQHARNLLANAPQIKNLAQQVLDCPEGQTVKVPRIKIPKPALEELVFMAISS